MTLQLFGHPFSSYTWKALIPLWEKDVAFEFRLVDAEHADNSAELQRRSPTGKFPLLADGDFSIFEATSIIEWADIAHPDPRLIPDGVAGLTVRMLDRLFDNYVINAMQGTVNLRLGIGSEEDAARGLATLDRSYAWLDANLAEQWATDYGFTLADCAAAPSLFYADWIHPIPDTLSKLKAYRARLLARPSVARAVDGARPYRHFFPGGAPDQD